MEPGALAVAWISACVAVCACVMCALERALELCERLDASAAERRARARPSGALLPDVGAP